MDKQFSITHLYQDKHWKDEFLERNESALCVPVENGLENLGNIVFRRKKFKFLPFYFSKITFGPAIDFSSHEHLKIALKTIISCAKENGDLYVQVHPFCFGSLTEMIRDVFLKEGFRRVSNYIYESTIIIDLAKSEEEIFKEFERRGREAVRQSERRGVISGKENITPQNLEIFYRLYTETCRRSAMIPEEREKIFKMVEFYDKESKAFLFFARFENIPLSAFVAFHCNDCLSLIYQGSDYSDNFQNKRPANNLYWYTMKWARKNGYRWFDLAGVTLHPAKGSKKEGIYLYKRQFGGTVVEFPGNFEFINRPILKSLLDLFLPFYSKLALHFQKKKMIG